ncbi:hypothetical protein ABZP36_007311 [Zizania latifolia]
MLPANCASCAFLLPGPKSRVHYYACETLYNIAKVVRGDFIIYFNKNFDALCKLSADSDANVQSTAHLLDRLVKEAISRRLGDAMTEQSNNDGSSVDEKLKPQKKIESTEVKTKTVVPKIVHRDPKWTNGSIPLNAVLDKLSKMEKEATKRRDAAAIAAVDALQEALITESVIRNLRVIASGHNGCSSSGSKEKPWSQLSPMRCTADTWTHLDFQPLDIGCLPTNLGWDASVSVLGTVPSLVKLWKARNFTKGQSGESSLHYQKAFNFITIRRKVIGRKSLPCGSADSSSSSTSAVRCPSVFRRPDSAPLPAASNPGLASSSATTPTRRGSPPCCWSQASTPHRRSSSMPSSTATALHPPTRSISSTGATRAAPSFSRASSVPSLSLLAPLPSQLLSKSLLSPILRRLSPLRLLPFALSLLFARPDHDHPSLFLSLLESLTKTSHVVGAEQLVEELQP